MTQPNGSQRLPRPDEQRAKALDLLEFTEVRQRLGRYASWPLGQEATLALKPSFGTAEVQRLGAETAEARKLLSEGSDLDLHAAVDIRTHLERAQKAGPLTGQELTEVVNSLFEDAEGSILSGILTEIYS